MTAFFRIPAEQVEFLSAAFFGEEEFVALLLAHEFSTDNCGCGLQFPLRWDETGDCSEPWHDWVDHIAALMAAAIPEDATT